MLRYAALFLLLLTLFACQQNETPPPTESVATLAPGWNLIEPGGETICSNNTPFAFYVRPGDTDKVLLYFQGGGACWFGQTCDLGMTPSYDPVVDEQDNPSTYHGIFAFDNEENPFADYSTVFIPYCTGDLHVGNTVTTYPVPATDSTQAREVTIQHKGHTNVDAVLTWTFDHFTDPERLFIAGSSAGAFPSVFYLPDIAEQYPDALIAQLADGAGGYRGMDYGAINDAWDAMSVLPDYPEFAEVTAEEPLLEAVMIAAARRYPTLTLSQFNTAGDEVQLQFLAMGGITNTSLLDLLEANYADVHDVVSNVKTFTAGGTVHTILGRPEFYSYQANGIRFRDWIAALANDMAVEDVMCTSCDRPSLYDAGASLSD